MKALRTVLVSVVVAVSAMATAAGAVGSTTAAPTTAAITAAIAAVQGSNDVWATFNICGPAADPDWVGLRGQMPALSFPTRMLMVVTLSAYSATRHRYVRVPGHWTENLGLNSDGTLVQQGVRLRFNQPITVIGHVTFKWFRDGKLLGETTRATTGGITTVGDSDPRGYSVATCSVS